MSSPTLPSRKRGKNKEANARKIKQSPPGRVRVGFGNLKEGLLLLRHVGVGERKLVNGILNARITNAPPQIPAGLAFHGVARP